jgi:hypothetical protein
VDEMNGSILKAMVYNWYENPIINICFLNFVFQNYFKFTEKRQEYKEILNTPYPHSLT